MNFKNPVEVISMKLDATTARLERARAAGGREDNLFMNCLSMCEDASFVWHLCHLCVGLSVCSSLNAEMESKSQVTPTMSTCCRTQ